MLKIKYIYLIILVMLSLTACSVTQKVATTYNDKNINNTIDTNSVLEEGKHNDNDEEEPNPVDKINMSLKPNEIGEVMIVMYHGIGDEEKSWQRTPDNFRKDLEYMYHNGYRMISLNDYAKGIIKTEEGFTPIVLTFDDGRRNNFNVIEKENGELEIDPDCAVGILEQYKTKYPDFNVTASFFLCSDIFGQEKYIDYKLKWLVENGYDIGNHTYSHKEIAGLTKEEINLEIGSEINLLSKSLDDYSVETIALPKGSNPKEECISSVVSGEYDGKRYKNIAVLDVGWRPAYSPFDTCNDFNNLYRVTGSETNVDGCGIYDYFEQFKNNEREKFISDGNPDVVTIPQKYEQFINRNIVGTRILNIY